MLVRIRSNSQSTVSSSGRSDVGSPNDVKTSTIVTRPPTGTNAAPMLASVEVKLGKERHPTSLHPTQICKECSVPDSQNSAESEVNAMKLCDKDGRHRLIKGGPIHVHCRPLTFVGLIAINLI